MAHATFHTLKNQGDNCEHHEGHGEQKLSGVFAMLMRLAFLVDQTQQWCCAWCRAGWHQLGSKRLLWERLRALGLDDALESMRQRLEALFDGLQTSAPVFAVDASSSRMVFLACQFDEPGERRSSQDWCVQITKRAAS